MVLPELDVHKPSASPQMVPQAAASISQVSLFSHHFLIQLLYLLSQLQSPSLLLPPVSLPFSPLPSRFSFLLQSISCWFQVHPKLVHLSLSVPPMPRPDFCKSLWLPTNFPPNPIPHIIKSDIPTMLVSLLFFLKHSPRFCFLATGLPKHLSEEPLNKLIDD